MGAESLGNGSAPTRGASSSVCRRNRESLLQVVDNPFENESPWTAYEIFKALLLGPTLFLIRLFVFLWCYVWMALLCRVVTSCSSAKMVEDRGCLRHDAPMPRWGHVVLMPVTIFNRGILWCLGFWRIRIIDHRKDRKEMPNIIVGAPHMNPADPFVLAWAFPPLPSGVGKKELLSGAVGALMGPIAVAGQGIFVDRDSSGSRLACKEAIAARATEGWRGASTMIFPEGTTTNGKVLIQFKNGPFGPGKPVLPVLLKYPAKHLNISWVGKMNNLGTLLLRMMLQFVNHCEIEILEVYRPSPEEQADEKLFAQNVRSVMAERLGVSTTEHSYADLKMSLEAYKAGIGNDFHVDEMIHRYGVDFEQLKGWLRDFRKMDKDHSGTISFAEFQKVMSEDTSTRARSSTALERIFTFFDTDQTGHLSYRAFVQGMALLSGRCSGTARAKLCFLLCDNGGTGKVSKSKLQESLMGASSLADPAPTTQLLEGLPEEVGFEEFSSLAEGCPELLTALLEVAPSGLTPSVRAVPEGGERDIELGAVRPGKQH